MERGQAPGTHGPLPRHHLSNPKSRGFFMKNYQEKVDVPFDGTIIDIESIGSFNNLYSDNDSRLYKNIKPTIFGSINSKELKILCAENEEEIKLLIKKINLELHDLTRPVYAFNTRFESSVIYHSCGLKLPIDREINIQTKEKKKYAVQNNNVDNHNDPFFDDGYKCLLAWQQGDHENSIKHNRSCLLKERDLLLLRGSRKPDELVFLD
ncbi:TPA: hypothetical protein HA344_05385 [Candidatus Bathyarchaeota archaeon]|nr:hypothetical protein [Candidatus Bathyarchaeota archaeon]